MNLCIDVLHSSIHLITDQPVFVRPDDADAAISVDCLRISFSQELQLVLYRHWTLYDSLCHTDYTACKFCVWTSNGRRLLREFLACMGLVCTTISTIYA